jgi:hypothetical protein
MTYYKRESNSGHVIEWSPDNEQAAVQSIVEVSGTGINNEQEAQENYAELDNDTAQRVREQYNDIVTPDESEN